MSSKQNNNASNQYSHTKNLQDLKIKNKKQSAASHEFTSLNRAKVIRFNKNYREQNDYDQNEWNNDHLAESKYVSNNSQLKNSSYIKNINSRSVLKNSDIMKNSRIVGGGGSVKKRNELNNKYNENYDANSSNSKKKDINKVNIKEECRSEISENNHRKVKDIMTNPESKFKNKDKNNKEKEKKLDEVNESPIITKKRKIVNDNTSDKTEKEKEKKDKNNNKIECEYTFEKKDNDKTKKEEMQTPKKEQNIDNNTSNNKAETNSNSSSPKSTKNSDKRSLKHSVFMPNSSSDDSTLSSSEKSLYLSISLNKKGLRNLGNTCFMNTCLQNLMHCAPFIKRLVQIQNELYSSTPRKKRLSREFFELCKSQSDSSSSSLYSNRYSSPDSLKDEFSRKHIEYCGCRQHDTQEFCRLLLEDISKELNTVVVIPPYKELNDKGKTKETLNVEYDKLFRARENSIIIDTFYGQFVNIFSCPNCNNKSFSFEKFLDMPILLDNNHSEQSLSSLLNKNFELDSIEWGNKCEKCGKKTTHSKEIRLGTLPEILILSLQRSNGRSYRKNNASIRFHEELNLEKFVDKDCVGNVSFRYTLIGIGNHSGSLDFGHYYSYNKLGNEWYEFNDSSVSSYSVKCTSCTAYVLFYQRQDTF